jgi:hypothetical protein
MGTQFDAWIDEAVIRKPCSYCERIKDLGRGRRENEPDKGFIYESSCEAYPNGIPNLIYNGFWDHRKPFEGDGGKMFLNREIITLDGKKYKIGWKGMPEDVDL